MKFNELNTRQKQQIIVGALAAIIALILVRNFVIEPMGKKRKEAVATIADLQIKVSRAQELIPNMSRVRELIGKRGEELTAQTDAYLPLPGNEFAWAAGLVYSVGRQTNQEDLEVKDIGRTTRDPRSTAPVQYNPFLQSYTVKVSTICSFDQLKNFLEALEQRNPYLTVSGLKITERKTEFERQNVEMQLQWPIWADSQFLKNLVSSGGKTP